jgi:membrane associated rhomboid family serine protease
MITLIKLIPHALMIVFGLYGLSFGIAAAVGGAVGGQIIGWIIRRILIGNIGLR